MSLITISSNSLFIAFGLYILSFFCFTWAVIAKGATSDVQAVQAKEKKWSRWGFLTVLAGFIAHLVYFITRWMYSGHTPTSNMFEFMTFWSMTIIFAFIVFYLVTRKALFGVFSVPLGVILIAFASVFPREVQPLIPALKSYWLSIHVTLAALGEAFFAIGFAAGLLYLLSTLKVDATDRESIRAKRWLDVVLAAVFSIIVFVVLVFSFRSTGVTYPFGVSENGTGGVLYVIPPIIGPQNAVETYEWAGISLPIVESPSWMNGLNAARKFNTIVWTVVFTALLYLFARITFARKGLSVVLSKMTRSMEPEDLDELSYRTIAIGYPIFTLGGLIFAMIWAHEAWGRFWAWDPKETWALIVFLFYTVYLHLRLSRSWSGARSAWLTVIGFLIVMFTLVGVNLVIAGLHSYAGV